jgi:protein O-mannosyl-transferase
LNLSPITEVPKSKRQFGLSAAVIISIIAAVYWPVQHAQFVWDDILDFQRMAWLRHGDSWQHMLLQRFNDWVAYFRPLGVALFTAEVRAFGATPGPMHLVSLMIHLANTLLVGVLAMQLGAKQQSKSRRIHTLALAMLLYGLHPVLVEPVVWIGCQFDLVATLFMLLGWLVSIRVRHPGLRLACVSLCFFLAACAKESAVAFLPILIVFDWFAISVSSNDSRLTQLQKLLKRNSPTYTGVVLAGAAYLMLRHMALGHLIPNTGGEVLPLWGRLQEASFLYLHYWRMFFWPTVHMGPIHQVNIDQFLRVGAWSLLQDVIAVCLATTGIVLTIRRTYAGALVLSVTLALFPVLHIIATNFDSSLYHERYALTALAVACAWFPLVLSEIPTPPAIHRTLSTVAYIGLAIWLTLAAMNIRATVPLWSTQVSLWEWALQENPDSVGAKDELISGYIDAGRYNDAWRLIDNLVASNTQCVNCMLNAATLSLRESNPKRADFFLQKIKNSPELYSSPTSTRVYFTDVGTVELLEGKLDVAEHVLQVAVSLDKLDSNPQSILAEVLALEGKTDEARQVESTAIALMEPDERAQQEQRFARILKQIHDNPLQKP